MSRFSITVGDRIFPSKKAALAFYKQIIDRYNFGEKLSDEDAKSLIQLGFKEEGTPEEVVMVKYFRKEFKLLSLKFPYVSQGFGSSAPN